MNIESLGRQAIERIKSEWGLPKRGFLAGGSIANIVWELVSGNKAVVSDIDIFIFDSLEEKINTSNRDTLFNYQEKETKYYEDYTGMCFNTYTKDFYSIIEAERDGMFNNIRYKSNTEDPSLIIKSFDINSTRIGYSIEKDEISWTPDFEEFLKTGTLKVTNLMTPSHTAVRIAKKSKELKAKVDTFEFKLLQYALGHNFSDRIKFRFKERYHQMYKDNLDILDSMFSLSRDTEAEQYVKSQYGDDTELYYLKSKVEDGSPELEIPYFINTSPSFGKIFGSPDNNVNIISKSVDFLFYMRNIWGNENLQNIWKNVYYFFTNVSYIDREVNNEDLELLSRFSQYAPKSIENLKGLKISEQIDIIKTFLDKFKEDPLIAISILEKIKVTKDLVLDDETALILELSVRKEIINDTRNKVRRILKNDSNQSQNFLVNF